MNFFFYMMILEDVNWLQDAAQIQNENILIADANHSRIIETFTLSLSLIKYDLVQYLPVHSARHQKYSHCRFLSPSLTCAL